MEPTKRNDFQSRKITQSIHHTKQKMLSKVNPQEALQTKVLNELPVKTIHTQSNTTNQYSGNLEWVDRHHQQIIKHPHFTKQQKELWHDYKLMQYDQTAGHHYLPASFFKLNH